MERRSPPSKVRGASFYAMGSIRDPSASNETSEQNGGQGASSRGHEAFARSGRFHIRLVDVASPHLPRARHVLGGDFGGPPTRCTGQGRGEGR
jgi:hypothetical protein